MNVFLFFSLLPPPVFSTVLFSDAKISIFPKPQKRTSFEFPAKLGLHIFRGRHLFGAARGRQPDVHQGGLRGGRAGVGLGSQGLFVLGPVFLSTFPGVKAVLVFVIFLAGTSRFGERGHS